MLVAITAPAGDCPCAACEITFSDPKFGTAYESALAMEPAAPGAIADDVSVVVVIVELSVVVELSLLLPQEQMMEAHKIAAKGKAVFFIYSFLDARTK